MAEYIGTKYPEDSFVVVRDQTFSVKPALHVATAEDGESPRKVFNRFSRFVLTIISSKTGTKVSPFANIRTDEIPGIIEKTSVARMLDMQMRLAPQVAQKEPVSSAGADLAHTVVLTVGAYAGLTPADVLKRDGGKEALKDAYRILRASAEIINAQEQMDAIQHAANASAGQNSPAYTYRFQFGALAGKSPAEVAVEMGEQRLFGQRKFFVDNLGKYPANQEGVDAIDEAIRLLRAGRLSAPVSAPAVKSASNSGQSVVLYEAPFRALERRKNENGKSFVYDLKIAWNFGRDYPVSVEISNYYAPVTHTSKGTLNVQKEYAEDKKTAKILLMDSEWANCLYSMKSSMDTFAVLNAKRIEEDVQDALRRAKAEIGTA